MKPKLKKYLRISAGILAVAIVLLFSACIYFRIHSPIDAIAYCAMIQEDFHPVWKDLAMRRIRKGDPVETVVSKHPPLRHDVFPPYEHLQYGFGFGGIGIAVKNGRLISADAGSCTWEHNFFITPKEYEPFGEAYTAYVKQCNLESRAYVLHRAIINNQDIFIASRIHRKPVTNGWLIELHQSWDDPSVPEPAGPDYNIEVTKVLHGEMTAGFSLKVPETSCDGLNDSEDESVVVRFSDWNLRYVNYKGNRTGEVYTSISKDAFDWYQSLTDEQHKEYATRMEIRWKKKLERDGQHEDSNRPADAVD